jgi:hypothetical protein
VYQGCDVSHIARRYWFRILFDILINVTEFCCFSSVARDNFKDRAASFCTIRTVTEDTQSEQVKSVLNKYETFVVRHCTQTLASFTHLLSLQPTFLRPILTMMYKRTPGRNNSVGIATRYRLDGPGIESRCERDFEHPSILGVGPAQPPTQWVQSLSRG